MNSNFLDPNLLESSAICSQSLVQWNNKPFRLGLGLGLGLGLEMGLRLGLGLGLGLGLWFGKRLG